MATYTRTRYNTNLILILVLNTSFLFLKAKQTNDFLPFDRPVSSSPTLCLHQPKKCCFVEEENAKLRESFWREFKKLDKNVFTFDNKTREWTIRCCIKLFVDTNKKKRTKLQKLQKKV